jgi:hypothetical protein
MKSRSGILERTLPTKGLRTNEEMLKAPIRTPISVSPDSNLERKIGRVGTRILRAVAKMNCAKNPRRKSRVNIFLIVCVATGYLLSFKKKKK